MKFKPEQNVIVVKTGKQHTVVIGSEPVILSKRLLDKGFIPMPNESYILSNGICYYDYELKELIEPVT